MLYFLAKEDSLEIYTPEHSYIMYAGTKNEKKVWLQKLRTAVAQALHGEEANESYEIGSNNLDNYKLILLNHVSTDTFLCSIDVLAFGI